MEFAEFINRFTDCKFVLNGDLSIKCGYKTGGRAKYLVTPFSVKSLAETLDFCKKNGIKSVIIGNGTNVLISDKGFVGAVIYLGKIRGIKAEGEFVTALCGEPISSVCAFAEKNSLSGLENFCGIPGFIGGAIYMNAGAFGKEMSCVVSEVVSVKNGKLVKYRKEECKFSYRKSRFYGGDEVIVSATFHLKKGDRSDIKAKTDLIFSQRAATQPKGRTCGSVFLNPKGKKAAFLIESAGLKGLAVGGAKVSFKHANFIVAEKGATSADIYELIKTVKQKVYAFHGVRIKEEIVYIGEF